MSLSAALPFMQMLAIITGVGIIMLTMIVSYCAVAVGVNRQLGIWYARQLTYMENARAISARVAIEEKNGCKYWHAGLANWFGLGGIAIGPAMKTVAEAKAVVLENDMYHNVFAVNESYAVSLASSTSVPAGRFVAKILLLN